MATHKIILGRIGKTDNRGEVQLQIIHERLHREIDIGFRVEAQYFANQRITKANPNASKMNEKISAAVNAADAVLVEHAGEYLGIDELKDYILNRMQYQGKTPLLSEYRKHLLSIYVSKGQRESGGQIERSCGYFDDFTGNKLMMHQINEDNLTAYKLHLETKGKSDNTIQTYLTHLKIAWKLAVKEKHVSKLRETPFTSNIFPGWQEGKKRSQSAGVIKKIANGGDDLTELQRQALEVRMLQYLIQGIDVIDLVRLKKSNIIDDKITLPCRFKNRRKKIKSTYVVHVPKEAYSIINKYQCDSFMPIFENIEPGTKEYITLRSVLFSSAQVACKKLNLPNNVGGKAIRQTWATHAEELSNNNFLLPKIGLGHSIGDMTAKYVNIDRKKIDQLNSDVAKYALNNTDEKP